MVPRQFHSPVLHRQAQYSDSEPSSAHHLDYKRHKMPTASVQEVKIAQILMFAFICCCWSFASGPGSITSFICLLRSLLLKPPCAAQTKMEPVNEDDDSDQPVATRHESFGVKLAHQFPWLGSANVAVGLALRRRFLSDPDAPSTAIRRRQIVGVRILPPPHLLYLQSYAFSWRNRCLQHDCKRRCKDLPFLNAMVTACVDVQHCCRLCVAGWQQALTVRQAGKLWRSCSTRRGSGRTRTKRPAPGLNGARGGDMPATKL